MVSGRIHRTINYRTCIEHSLWTGTVKTSSLEPLETDKIDVNQYSHKRPRSSRSDHWQHNISIADTTYCFPYSAFNCLTQICHRICSYIPFFLTIIITNNINKICNKKIFLSFFKTLVGKEIAVELKNDVVMTGTLHSVDQYLNVKLLNVKVINPEKYPQLIALKNCFVRGSVVRYIQIPPEHVDTELLQDATRRENAPASSKK